MNTRYERLNGASTVGTECLTNMVSSSFHFQRISSSSFSRLPQQSKWRSFTHQLLQPSRGSRAKGATQQLVWTILRFQLNCLSKAWRLLLCKYLWLSAFLKVPTRKQAPSAWYRSTWKGFSLKLYKVCWVWAASNSDNKIDNKNKAWQPGLVIHPSRLQPAILVPPLMLTASIPSQSLAAPLINKGSVLRPLWNWNVETWAFLVLSLG